MDKTISRGGNTTLGEIGWKFNVSIEWQCKIRVYSAPLPTITTKSIYFIASAFALQWRSKLRAFVDVSIDSRVSDMHSKMNQRHPQSSSDAAANFVFAAASINACVQVMNPKVIASVR